MLVRGAFNHFLRPGLRPDFRDSYQEYSEEYSRYLKTGNQDRAEIEAVTLSGLPRQVLRGESEAVTYIDPVMSDKVVYIDDEYASGFIVSKRMMEDDLYNKAKQNAKWLGRSVRLTQEYLGAALLDDAFAGAVFTGLFDEVLCETTHENLNAGVTTWSNRLATDVQLGITGLQAAYDLHAALIDHQGDPIVSRPNRLVIDITDEWVAIQLTQNPDEAFTTDRNINAFRQKGGLNYVVAHYKTQDGSWFFQDPNLIDSHFLFRVRPEFDDTMDFDTLSAKFWARQRVNVYFYDQRGWVGSEP